MAQAAQAEGAFLSDVKTLRERARQSLEKGAVTPTYQGDINKAIVGKPTDRGRDGKARYAKFFAQTRLVDQTAGFERSGENRFLEFAVYGVRFCMGALGQVPTCSLGEAKASPDPANMLDAREAARRRQSSKRHPGGACRR